MKQIELFAGIGGFGLAGEMAGIETVAQIEWDKYCQKVLKKNFPNAKQYGDIKEFDGTPYRGAVDIISGGFPCQPFSTAGSRKGADDDRFLWPEMLRVIREVQPPWVIGENVAGILSMDNGNILEDICASLESEGYEVQPFVIPACAVQAPHRRDRVWIIAYSRHNESQRRRLEADNKGRNSQRKQAGNKFTSPDRTHGQVAADSKINKTNTGRKQGVRSKPTNDNRQVAADSGSKGLQGGKQSGTSGEGTRTPRSVAECDSTTSNATFRGWNKGKGWPKWQNENNREGNRRQWSTPWPEVATRLCRVGDGLPSWVDGHRTNRLKALGNAIVPQVAYEIFKAIANQ